MSKGSHAKVVSLSVLIPFSTCSSSFFNWTMDGVSRSYLVGSISKSSYRHRNSKIILNSKMNDRFNPTSRRTNVRTRRLFVDIFSRYSSKSLILISISLRVFCSKQLYSFWSWTAVAIAGFPSKIVFCMNISCSVISSFNASKTES